MEDFLPKQSKGTILRGMMRNPSISKTIRDAVKSPIGSTSRIKAKKILSIMQKLHESNNGQGGPGMTYERMFAQPQMSYSQPAPENPRGIVVFHKIPKPNIIYGKKPEPTLDGAGGPGSYDGKGGIFDMTGFNNIFSKQQVFGQNTSSSFGPSNFGPFGQIANKTFAPFATSTAPVNQGPSTFFGLTPPGGTATLEQIRQQKVGRPSSVAPMLSGVGAMPIPSGLNKWGVPLSDFGITPLSPGFNEWGLPIPGYDKQGKKGAEDTWFSELGYDAQGKRIEPIIEQGVETDTPVWGQSFPSGELPSTLYPEGIKRQEDSYIAWSKIWEPTSEGPIDREVFDIALIGQESGDTYGITNPDSGALGKYQIMPNYWFDVIGLDSNNPADIQKFLETPQLQDKLYEHIISGLISTHNGNLDKILAEYYGGSKGAQVVGTAAGDVSQGKYPSINRYVAEVKARMGIATKAKEGIDPTKVNPDGTPKSWFQRLSDKWNISELQERETEIFNEGRALSDARNRYLLQTDAAINGYIDNLMKSEDMSNPANVAAASSQLKYLYTLRGNATQSYLGILETSINQKQAALADNTRMYGTAIAAYQNELRYPNTISEERYVLLERALTDMDNELSGAGDKTGLAGELARQFFTGTAQSAADSIAAEAKRSLIVQQPKIEGYWKWDGTETIDRLPSLIDTIRVFASQAPEIEPVNIMSTYLQAVLTYAGKIDVKESTSGANAARAIDPETKKSILLDAIQEFATLYSAFIGDAAITNFSISAIHDNLLPRIAEQVSEQLLPVAEQLMESIQTLAPGKSWLGGTKETPTEDQFLETVKKLTGDDPVAIEVAPMIYSEFLRSMLGEAATATIDAIPAQTREESVKSFLYLTSSTSTVDTPVSTAQFANRMGQIYANSIYSQYFIAQ